MAAMEHQDRQYRRDTMPAPDALSWMGSLPNRQTISQDQAVIDTTEVQHQFPEPARDPSVWDILVNTYQTPPPFQQNLCESNFNPSAFYPTPPPTQTTHMSTFPSYVGADTQQLSQRGSTFINGHIGQQSSDPIQRPPSSQINDEMPWSLYQSRCHTEPLLDSNRASPAPEYQYCTTERSNSTSSKVDKRHRNTAAARRYRQKRAEQVSTLESELDDTKKERDQLRLRNARLETEIQVLRQMIRARR